MLLFINYPTWIKPEIFPFLPIRWYSLMYIVAFAITYILFNYQIKKGEIDVKKQHVESLFTYMIVGLLLGARLFSVFLYDDALYYLTHPHYIFWPFRGGKLVGLPGMSYHGGVVGAAIGLTLALRKYKYNFLRVADAVVAGIPLGYTFGRLGNFINGELWGRVSTKPFAIIFPAAPEFSTNYSWVREIANKIGMDYEVGSYINLPRHPSQLYEAFGEGILLFLVIWFILRKIKNRPKGFLLGSYITGYALVRFIIEYFREPDANLGFIINLGVKQDTTAIFKSFLNISMGQILSFLMMLFGISIIYLSYYLKRRENE